MGYIDDAFDGLKEKLEIGPAEQDLAKSRHRLIRDHVKSVWTTTGDFLTGSYDRHTKTKKLKDVDIFIVIDRDGPQSHLADGTGTAAVNALCQVLRTRWPNVTGDDYVALVEYAGEDVASYEIAPVFARAGGGYLMPSGSGWMATDPNTHAEMVTAKNKDCGGKFVPFVKMVKGINREAGDPIAPAFLIEVMALELVRPPFGRYRDEIRWFLASAAEQITDDWPDPVGLGPDVNSGLSHADRQQLAATLQGWQHTCEEAILLENAGKDRSAVETWKTLFGWRMPRP
ncbi:CBASS oligonucleotide cyclase [Micromonospora sp. NPDC023956]|uniref:CBASS oligonucleotide cyclase n=1 Tax=Micromonospora sp. NPDC023956 TaxID=3155722 RepID=UPI003402E964